jgi:hypothetical protein
VFLARTARVATGVRCPVKREKFGFFSPTAQVDVIENAGEVEP